MNIKGSRGKEIAVDLLGSLAAKQQTGNTISKTEVKKVLAEIKSELKDEFCGSNRGLTAAGRAVENTLKLALESGWVKGDTAASMIEDFLEGGDDSQLSDLLGDIRKSNRKTSRSSYGRSGTVRRRTPRSSYSSRSISVRPRRSHSVGT